MSLICDVQEGKGWVAYHADTIDVARELPDNSIHFSVFSPPFSSLYTYSASDRDMGNVKDDAQFFDHYRYLVREQFRAMMPGRLVAVHCMLIPTSKARDGFIGFRDFRGDLRREYEAAGFISHSEVCIWKNPVTAMQRTKALGLLHKQIKKDSCMSRQGFPDYLVVMRKPGVNPEPVSHTNETFPVSTWQRYASPVWVTTDVAEDGSVKHDDEDFEIPKDPKGRDDTDECGISQSNTLNARGAREHDDERHLAPLQLGVIKRCLRLWSNPGDVVWSPFMGVGSEGVGAIEQGRCFVGAELKDSYFRMAAQNLRDAEAAARQPQLRVV